MNAPRPGIAIAVLWAALILPGAFSRGFWNPDEGRYGEVAREVWQGKGALVLHLAGEPYAEKPPLFFWAVAAAQMVGGPNGPASRVPSALATLGTALLLFSLVRRTHGEAEGFFAALLLLSSELVFQMGGWVGIDATAMLFVTLAVYAQERALGGGRSAGRWRVAIHLSVAATILTKGAPVFIAIAALAGRAWLERGWRGLAPRHLRWGVPLVLGVLGLWAVPAALAAGREYLWEMTGAQAGRRLLEAEGHQRSFFYYLIRIPVQFLPAAVLLPAAVKVALDDWRAGGGRRSRTGTYVLWALVPLVFFSLVSGKRERYLLPAFPALAALAGVASVRLGAARLVRTPLRVALALLGMAGVVVALAPFLFGPLVLPRLGQVDARLAVELRSAIAGAAAILLAGGISATLAAADGLWRRRLEAPVVPLAAVTGFLVLTVGAGIVPALDRAKSAAPLVDEVRALGLANPRWGVVRLERGPICIALRTDRVATFEGEDAAARAAAALAADPSLVLFDEESTFEAVREAAAVPLQKIAERGVGRRRLVAFRAKLP